MKYCKKCLMPDTRPGLIFDINGICTACLNYEKQKTTDWNKRLQELKDLCDHHRGCNGNGPDCAIAVSGGKDSHFQIHVLYVNYEIICNFLKCYTWKGKAYLFLIW